MRVAKGILFILALTPFLLLGYGVVNDSLGANPVEKITHTTGDWALRFLLLTLTVTPLRKLTGQVKLIRFRRMLGLFSFFYVCLHFTTWIWLDHGFYWEEVIGDIVKRPYVTVGFTAFLLLIPLASTSTKGMMRRLGRRWQSLHKLVYPIALLGVLHYIWLVKADWLEPVIYALMLLVLLIFRLPDNSSRRWFMLNRRQV